VGERRGRETNTGLLGKKGKVLGEKTYYFGRGEYTLCIRIKTLAR
jgi:hypothetical protein